MAQRKRSKSAPVTQEMSQLWEAQRRVLEQAGKVVQDAGQKVAAWSSEEVTPRIRDAAEQLRHTAQTRVAPAVESGLHVTGQAVGHAAHSASQAARTAKTKVVEDVLPAVTGVIRSAITLVELSKVPAVRDALKASKNTVLPAAKRAGEAAKSAAGAVVRRGAKAAPAAAKSAPRHGAGTVLLIGIGVAVAAGLAVAAWKTFRADDALWLETADADGAARQSGESEADADEFFG